MAVESTMLALGTKAPDFTLPEPKTGSSVSLSNYTGKPLLVMFICNHCPYVLHILEQLTIFIKEYQEKGLEVVAISSNDIANYPDDSPEKMAEMATKLNFTFAYLYDESQVIAKAYKAACTPDFYMFDAEHKLYYRGRFDNSNHKNGNPVTGAEMRAAADALLQGQPIPENQIPSMGCNIKWKEGNAPEYFSL